MFKINCQIEIVVHAGADAYPEVLIIGSTEHLIIPPEVLFPLRLVNGRIVTIKFAENDTIKQLIKNIKREIQLVEPGYNYWDYIEWALAKEDRYYIDDYNQNLLYLCKKYFGYPNDNTLKIQFLLSANAGEVDNAEGLEYYVYSHEKGKHHLPHVHVNSTDHNHSAVISIKDGSIIEGKLPEKLKKKAKKRILDKQQFFYECWNNRTDGIRVDINKHFHLIGY